MPVFGLGTWLMGGDINFDPKNDDQADIKAIKTAIDLGITHIDTAEKYAQGHAEEFVGQAIKDSDRSKLFIVSKVSDDNLKYDDVLKSCLASLKRLETNYLDLYLIHSPNHEIPIKATMRALDKLKADGLIKNIGVSNFSIASFKAAQSCTKNKIVVNQVHYNLIIREAVVSGLLKYCQENDVILEAYRPFEKGMLFNAGGAALDKIANKYQKTKAQVVINWLIFQANVVTLSKMREPEHIKENLDALTWQLSDEDVEWLKNNFSGQKDRSPVCPLL